MLHFYVYKWILSLPVVDDCPKEPVAVQGGSPSCSEWIWGRPFHSLPQRGDINKNLGLHSLPLKLNHLWSFRTADTQYFCALISVLSCCGCKAGIKVFHGSSPWRSLCARTVPSSRAPYTDSQAQKKAELCFYTGFIVDSVRLCLPCQRTCAVPFSTQGTQKHLEQTGETAFWLGGAIRMCRKPETWEEKPNCLEIPEERIFISFQKPGVRVSNQPWVNKYWSLQEWGQRWRQQEDWTCTNWL